MYPCKYCDKSFDKRAQRSQHQYRSHTAPEKACRHCGMLFKPHRDLKRHEATHDPDPKLHACDREDCEESFTRKDNLARHIKTCRKPANVSRQAGSPALPRGDPVDKEETMSETRAVYQTLRAELPVENMQPTRPNLTCPLCGRVCDRRSVLELHMETHNPNPKRYYCDRERCNASYTTLGSLNKHKRSHHNNEDLQSKATPSQAGDGDARSDPPIEDQVSMSEDGARNDERWGRESAPSPPDHAMTAAADALLAMSASDGKGKSKGKAS